jgi:phosphatidylserine/phosphatidylglycerophosphate/cardiolipin synthase-like enzyme
MNKQSKINIFFVISIFSITALYFIYNANVKDDEVYFTPSMDCKIKIIQAINSSKHTLNIAVYSITNKEIVEAIILANNRGVRVTVLTDFVQSRGRASKVDFLKNSGIEVLIIKGKTMHNKFSIFDNKVIQTGSYNYTNNANKRNYENCFFTKKKNIIFEFKKEFDLMREKGMAFNDY